MVPVHNALVVVKFLLGATQKAKTLNATMDFIPRMHITMCTGFLTAFLTHRRGTIGIHFHTATARVGGICAAHDELF